MTKRLFSTIRETSTTLRPLTEDDLPLTLAWRNADCNRVWFSHPGCISWEEHSAWFARYQERDNDYVWVIEHGEPSRPIGQLSLYNVDWQERRAEYGRLLIGDLSVRGKGLATLATRMCLQHATGAMGLHEVYCFIKVDNVTSRRACAAAGFFDATSDGQMVRMEFRAFDFAPTSASTAATR
jgi:RimJ/RimL family protein N-acetyltransferase